MPDSACERVDLRPDLSITVIIASGELSNTIRAFEERHATSIGRHPQRPRGASFVDRRSGGKLHGPGTAAPGVADHGERIGSGNPIGVHDAGEHVAACAASHRHARQRAHAERPLDVLRAEQHRHVARSRDRQDPRVLQLEIARIGAFRATEECGVGLPLPARAVDEALAIGREPADDTAPLRYVTWSKLGDGRLGHIDGTIAARTAAVSTAPATAPQRAARRGRRVRPARVVAPEPASAIHRNSAARSRAVCQRSSGSFARHRRISRSSAAGVCGCSDDSGSGSAATMAAMSDARLSPANGRRPQTSRRARRRTRRCRCARPPRAPRSARAPCREPSRRWCRRRSVRSW